MQTSHSITNHMSPCFYEMIAKSVNMDVVYRDSRAWSSFLDAPPVVGIGLGNKAPSDYAPLSTR